MKFSIVKEILHETLNDFTKIFETRTTTPIISHLYIDAQENYLKLIATNTEVTLEANIPAQVDEIGKITVPGGKFYDVVRYLPAGMFVNCYLDNHQFAIHAGKSQFSLTTLPAEDFPLTEIEVYDANIKITSNQLNRILQKVRYCVASDDPRYYLHGIYLNLLNEDNVLTAVATDGHRLSCAYTQAEIHKKDGKNGIILPKKAVAELIKLTSRFNEDLVLEFNERQLHLKLANYRFTTNLIDGEYPNYRQVIPNPQDAPIIIQRDKFLQALQRGKVLLIDKHDGIRLTFETNQLQLSARNQENETAKETLDIINNREDADCELALNINYLIESINNIEGENIQLHFESKDKPFLITSKDDQNIQYVIMPMLL